MTTTISNENIVTEIREKLDTMMGKSYRYGVGTYRFKQYFIYNARERVEIITDKRGFDRTFDTIIDFLKFFKETGSQKKEIGSILKANAAKEINYDEEYSRSNVVVSKDD